MSKNLSSIESDGKANPSSTPFFSIGVTTYNRPELLKQTLDSISMQTFSDFEVIVGNDFIQEPLSAAALGTQLVAHSPLSRSEGVAIGVGRGKLFGLRRGGQGGAPAEGSPASDDAQSNT